MRKLCAPKGFTDFVRFMATLGAISIRVARSLISSVRLAIRKAGRRQRGGSVTPRRQVGSLSFCLSLSFEVASWTEYSSSKKERKRKGGERCSSIIVICKFPRDCDEKRPRGAVVSR